MYKTNQLTGNVYNDSEVTVKVNEDICYAKYDKQQQRGRDPSPFGPFNWPKRRIFLPFHMLQLVKSLLFCIPEA